jgi:hypothetical protein
VRRLLTTICFVVSGILLGVAPGVAQTPATASVAFRGTVVRLAASNVELVQPDARTAIVRVDSVVSADDPVLRGLAGHEVTVQLTNSTLRQGDQALFLANPWHYGENVALSEVTRLASDAALPPAQLPENRPLVRRLASAQLIVVGTVTTTEDGDRISGMPKRRGTEHDPHWQVATVTVESRLKGAAPQTVQVIFASSRDVMWYRAPKLQSGQHAVFLLQDPGVISPMPRATAKLYTVLDPADVQPVAQLKLLSNLL